MITALPIKDLTELKADIKQQFVYAFSNYIEHDVLTGAQVNEFFKAIFKEPRLLADLEACFDRDNTSVDLYSFDYSESNKHFYTEFVIDEDFAFITETYEHEGFEIRVIDTYEPRDASHRLMVVFVMTK